jgi:hypothetical protein
MIYDSKGFSAELRAKILEKSGKQQLEIEAHFFRYGGNIYIIEEYPTDC